MFYVIVIVVFVVGILSLVLVGIIIGVCIVYWLLLDGMKILMILVFKKVKSGKVDLFEMLIKKLEIVFLSESFLLFFLIIMFIIFV